MAFGGAFGNSAFGASSSGFGNPSQNLFGQSSAPFGQSASSFGGFGQTSQGFGQSLSALGQSSSGFGALAGSQPSPWAQSNPAAFGSSQPFGSSNPYGASQPAFGSSQQSFGAQSQPLFASTQDRNRSSWNWSSLGQSQQFGGQSQFGGGSGNQQQQSQQPPSTLAAKYQVTQLYDTNSADSFKFMAISAMEQFEPYSIEELRVADYSRGDKSGGNMAGTGSFGSGFAGTTGAGFGSQSGSGFGNSAFGSQSQSGFATQSQSAFGTQSQPLFGGQAQSSLFGGSTGGGFGASSGGVFGSSANQAQSSSIFGGPSGGNVTGFTGFGPSGFGTSGAVASGFPTSSGAQSQSLFGGGNQQSGGGLFGGQAQTTGSLFGSQSQSQGGLFGSQPQSTGGLFGSQQQSGGIQLGGQQSGGGLFGAQPQGSGGMFGASSSIFGGSTGLGAPFGGQQVAQSAPSLFGAPSAPGFGAASAGGLFGGQTGGSLFGNTTPSLFGSGASLGGFGTSSGGLFGATSGPSIFGNMGAAGASSASLFGTGLAGTDGYAFNNPDLLKQQQGPLEASVTKDPYGHSQLFTSLLNQPALQPNGPSLPTLKPAGTDIASQSKDIRVIVAPKAEPQRTRGSQAIARQSFQLMSSESAWCNTSPVRRWGPQRSLFDAGTDSAGAKFNRASQPPASGWRNEEQKKKAANIRKLVIQPVEGDPILKAASGQSTGLLRGKRSMRRPASGRLVNNRPAEGAADAPEQKSKRKNGRPMSLPARPQRSHEQDSSIDGDKADADAETSVGSDPAEENGLEEGAEDENELKRVSTRKETSRNYADVENFDSRYVPYKDFYKTQMKRSRQQSGGTDIENPPHRQSVSVSASTVLKTSPSLTELQKMTSEELSAVESFKVWRPNVGEIEWQDPVDLRGVDLDETISIKPKEVCVYPQEEDVPPKGEGLNRAAVVRLHRIWKVDKETGQPRTDATTVAGIVRKLKACCDEDRLEFVGYEVRTGTWTFKATSF